MDTAADAEVVIVGGGPAGLSAAVGVALAGRTAAVVDPQEDHSVGTRAILVHAGTLAVLERMGCVEQFLAESAKVTEIRTNTRRSLLMSIRFDRLPGAYPFGVTLPQYRTEAILRARAQELGVRLVRGLASSVEQNADGATVALDDGRSLRGRFVVGADGSHSTIRRSVGIPYERHGMLADEDAQFFIAETALSGPVDHGRHNMYSGKDGVIALIPLPRGRMVLVGNQPVGDVASNREALQRILDARGPLAAMGPDGSRIRIEEAPFIGRYEVHPHLAATFRAGRVLLAGDAGHVHTTAGGQGMNLGMRDGWYLAHALDAALSAEDGGRADRADEFLEAYSANRRGVAERVMAAAEKVQRSALPRPGLRPIMHVAMRLADRLGAGSKQALALSGLLDTGPDVLVGTPHAQRAEPSGRGMPT